MPGSILEYHKELSDKLSSTKAAREKEKLQLKLDILMENEDMIRKSRSKTPEQIVNNLYFKQTNDGAIQTLYDDIKKLIDPIKVKQDRSERAQDQFKKALGKYYRESCHIKLGGPKGPRKKKSSSESETNDSSESKESSE